MQSQKVDTIFAYMKTLFGDEPKCELDYANAHELLISILLSAQCTDKRVNMVSPALFARYKTVEDFATADNKELESFIYSTGFYHNKAKNIIALCNVLKELDDIPNDVESLAKLPGIGRKTASVFVAEYHKLPAIPVDTHVMRVTKRLGLTAYNDPIKIERDLAQIIARENWASYHLYLVLFGRYHCTAKNPKCDDCAIKPLCKLQ